MTLFLGLGGCLLDGEIDAIDEQAAGTVSGEIQKSHTLTGSVGDGPVVNATIRVRAVDGEALGNAESGPTADFDIVVRTISSQYPLRLDAIGGTDLVTLAAPDFTMRSAVLDPQSRTVANLNPFTTVAMETAADLPGGFSSDNIAVALAIVVNELAGALDTMTPTGLMTSDIDGGNIAEMVRASEALGEVVRRTRDALGAAGHAASGNAVVAAIGSDLGDRVLDGRGGPRADARIAAVANVVLSQVMLETMANRLTVQGSEATTRMTQAIEQVYDGMPAPGFDDLLINDGMLRVAHRGLAAADAVHDDPMLARLQTKLAGLLAGMSPADAAAVTNAGDAVALGNVVLAVAAATGVDIDAINAAARGDRQPAGNRAPEIGGAPARSVDAGTTYRFAPSASDPDGDTVTFTVTNLPSWASFGTATGTLSGVPTPADVGTYAGISITASDGRDSSALPPFSIDVRLPAIANRAPAISGSPAASVLANTPYAFQPQASDPDGDSLTFSAGGLPSWAGFDAATGRLSGTPGDADIGVYDGISITVSDGRDSATFGPFQVAVDAITMGTVTITWTPPTENTDGSALTDLAGYRLYWGTKPGDYTESVLIDNPGLSAWVVENLAPGDYEFVSTAINADGVESGYSNPVARTIP